MTIVTLLLLMLSVSLGSWPAPVEQERRRPDVTVSPRPEAWPRDVTRERVRRLVVDCEKRTDRFKGTFRRALNGSIVDDTRREDTLNAAARQLERALDDVKRRVVGNGSYSATRDAVRRALDAGREIARAVRRLRLGGGVERAWLVLHGELNGLARLVALPPLT
jgi:hypothetical protein